MKSIFRNKLVWLCLIFLVIVSLNFFQEQRKNKVVFANQSTNGDEINQNIETKKEVEKNVISNLIVIDVKGAIKNPGVFEVINGNRVFDAIKLAGGFSEDADKNKVNLAAKLTDEMVIYVPKNGEEIPVSLLNIHSEKNNEGIDINHASQEELEKIPGIGPVKAKNILEYIETKGPFTSVDQLDKVNGIGKKSLELIRPFILIR
ncbi:helix-hairpin-helix domain-containing protein [Bacillus sp. EAC]|uniref:helix-hairpin-helix domain-containing protein n=1 Tax=Bacillus sp. EAC TaxID=1978338 RepID=UPI0015C513F0|nr:helix-hairpin-helix domain-containing protein [Bacillus sp. EAC]